MTAEHAIVFANLQALRAEVTRLSQEFRAVDCMSPEARAIREQTKVAEAAVAAEVSRIRGEGFGGDSDFEFKVMGRMMRHHTDPVLPPCYPESVWNNWRR